VLPLLPKASIPHYAAMFRLVLKEGKKSKAIPLTGREGPYGFETSRIPHFLDNRLTDDGEVVSLRRRPPFTPPGRFLVLISVTDCVDPRARVRLTGLGQLKNAMTSSGIEPATFRLVA
jgi:hypothetical protein